MTTSKSTPVAAAKQMLTDLERLVEAIDRRVPHLERLSEAKIAREAADLRRRAVKLIRELKAAAPPR